MPYAPVARANRLRPTRENRRGESAYRWPPARRTRPRADPGKPHPDGTRRPEREAWQRRGRPVRQRPRSAGTGTRSPARKTRGPDALRIARTACRARRPGKNRPPTGNRAGESPAREPRPAGSARRATSAAGRQAGSGRASDAALRRLSPFGDPLVRGEMYDSPPAAAKQNGARGGYETRAGAPAVGRQVTWQRTEGGGRSEADGLRRTVGGAAARRGLLLRTARRPPPAAGRRLFTGTTPRSPLPSRRRRPRRGSTAERPRTSPCCRCWTRSACAGRSGSGRCDPSRTRA